ncbi:MAG: MarC family protein [Chloroflexi bacterium]|nr:MarC family protein [Chloroflexota bacterium]
MDASYGKQFLLSFVPLFVAIDAVGSLAIIVGIIRDTPTRTRLRIVNIALTTALILGFVFLLVGREILRFLGIEVEHFAIAGGLVLLALGIREILGGKSIQDTPEQRELLAVVPIGTPLTTGPATLATLLVLNDKYSLGVIAPAYLANMAIAWLVFFYGASIAAFLGRGGLLALSKVASLLLAAIAVKLIIDGVTKAFNL